MQSLYIDAIIFFAKQIKSFMWALSSVGEHFLDAEGVVSSILTAPTIFISKIKENFTTQCISASFFYAFIWDYSLCFFVYGISHIHIIFIQKKGSGSRETTFDWNY